MDIMKELVTVVKGYCEMNGIKCRVLKSQFDIAQTGTRGGYDTLIAYYTNKAHDLQLYIDYDVMRGLDNEVHRMRKH